jgi:hypothetical protein
VIAFKPRASLVISAMLVISVAASIRVTDDPVSAPGSSPVQTSEQETPDGAAFFVFRKAAAGATIAGIKSQRPRILRITQ